MNFGERGMTENSNADQRSFKLIDLSIL